jgi:hypothetical protein
MKIQILKLFVMLSFTILLSNSLMAQNRMYAEVNAGYNLKTGTQTMLSDYTRTNSYVSSVSTSKAINVSMTKGMNFGVAVGYMFYKNVGAELGFSYLLGPTTKVKSGDNSANAGFNTGNSGDRTYSASMYSIVPSIVVAGGLAKVDPYAKLGLLIGFGTLNIDYNDNVNGEVTSENYKLNGGVSLGAVTAVGVKYNIGGRMSLFGEVNMVNLQYAPTTQKLTDYRVNGVDQLHAMTTKEKETQFVKKYQYDPKNPIPDTQPTQMTQVKQPVGSFGLNVGFSISF